MRIFLVHRIIRIPTSCTCEFRRRWRKNSLNSQVRTYSGEPIIIGGMLKQEERVEESKIPFLGDIPFLGMLFKTQNKSVTNSEIVIYIIPHVEYDYEEKVIEELELDRLYNKFPIRD